MKLERRNIANPRRRRRRAGVTLVEMLVTLAVLLLMMALIVQIFQQATSGMNAAQAFQKLDEDLRRVDSTLRSDLSGATARFTPPLNPDDDLGYFEYVENEFADGQGEDCDDSIRLTVKAPPGRPFTGRMWAKPPNVLTTDALGNPITVPMLFGSMSAVQLNLYLATQPITVTSEYAEVIYFLRNGNLYRRVLLVAPELQSKIVATVANTGFFPDGTLSGYTNGTFTPGALGGLQTSWQGVNDLSARPAARGTPTANHNQTIVLNTLGDLTDRHNRAFSPRFADDFVLLDGSAATPDGIPDDLNADNVPDFHPSLYYNAINDTVTGNGTTNRLWNVSDMTGIAGNSFLAQSLQSLGFPFIYRGSFSQAQQADDNHTEIGWIHAPAPFANDGTNLYIFNTDPVNYVKYLNHNPLDLGDDLATPYSTSAAGYANNLQTYWGYPTWRETLAPEWADPTVQVNQVAPYSHPFGLIPITANEVNQGSLTTAAGAAGLPGEQLLPPMIQEDAAGRVWRSAGQTQLFSDGAGSNTTLFDTDHTLWTQQSWEDDLLLTNVRSFDVKAFEPALADYADLGWGDDPRVTAPVSSATGDYLGMGNTPAPFLYGNYDAFTGGYAANAMALVNGRACNVVGQTFAHEGRMPPLRNDFRFDAQFGAALYPSLPEPFFSRVGDTSAYNGNVGDDSNTIVRMRRIWDTWSTTYSKAPATGVLPTTLPDGTVGPGGGFPYGPPFSPPIYPSYPAPYPAPLRGIQIQIRVTDPTSQHVKVLTIRQDFTDKL